MALSSGREPSEGNDKDDVKSPTTARRDDGDDRHFLARTRTWTQQVPIGLGLCPWAVRSQAKGRLHYAVCHATQSEHVAQLLEEEALKLVELEDDDTR